VRPEAGPNPLTEDLLVMKKKVVPFLINHPYSGPFRYPVNAKAEGIYPDYFKIVTRPMDLTTVKSRLENGYYPDLAACTADISQVWSNAKLYNTPEHTIHKWAVELGLITNGFVAKLPKPVNSPPARSSVVGRQRSPAESEREKSNQINLKVCENILETIMSEKMRYCAGRFHKIRTQYAADTYRPMDLTQIQNSLSQGRYKTPTQFATDFRLMISETYRFCIDKDPIIEQAQELHHQFEMAFAKRIQLSPEEQKISNVQNCDAVRVRPGRPGDETQILRKILLIGQTMEEELGKMIEKELAVLEEKRFHSAQLLVAEIENVPPEIMGDVILIMQRNREDLQVEPDGTVEVSYNDLSAKTISEIRKLLRAKNLINSQQSGLKSDIKDEPMNVDVR